MTEWHETEVEKEKESQRPLHPHYREISRLVLKNCSDSIKDVDQIGQLIEVTYYIYNIVISMSHTMSVLNQDDQRLYSIRLCDIKKYKLYCLTICILYLHQRDQYSQRENFQKF